MGPKGSKVRLEQGVDGTRQLHFEQRLQDRTGKAMRGQDWMSVLLLLLLISMASTSSSRTDCEDLRKGGGSQFDVLECLRRRTQNTPTDASAWLSLGLQLHSSNEVEDAMSAYRKVLELSPATELAATAHLHAGVVLHGRGEHAEALTEYQRSLALSPSSPNTLLNMAILQYLQGQTMEAMESCRRSIEISPDYFAAHAQLAIMQQQVGDIDEAVDSYLSSIRLKPDYAPSYFNLGTAHERAGDLTRAVEAYQQAVALEEASVPNPRFHARLAVALVELGHWERSMVFHFDGSRHCEPMGTHCRHEHHSLGFSGQLDPSLYFNIGMVYLDTFMHLKEEPFYLEQAARLLGHAARAAGEQGSVYHSAVYALGVVKELSRKQQEASSLFRQAVDAQPSSGLYLHALQRASGRENGDGQRDTRRGGATEEEGEDALTPLQKLLQDVSMFARTSDVPVSKIDRYGCMSSMIMPHEILQHIYSSAIAHLSKLSLVVNPFPPQRRSYPAEDAIPDHLVNLLQSHNGTVLLLSDKRELSEDFRYHAARSRKQLHPLFHPNTTDAEMLVQVVQEFVRASSLSSSSTIDFVLFDNITNGCEHALEFLQAADQHLFMDAKLVMFHSMRVRFLFPLYTNAVLVPITDLLASLLP
eukprot:750130-Hanusia_phi.AAC.2